MPTVNELLQDATTAHAVDLYHYSTSVVRRLIAILNRVDADLAAALSDALDRLPPESFTVERLEALLGSVAVLNRQAYARVFGEFADELREFAEYEAGFQYSLFANTIPEPVQMRFRVARVSFEQIYAAALSRPFQGRLLRPWASKVEADRMELLRNSVRMGYIEGQTTSQIVQRIRGTRAKRYADGALNRSRRELETVVRTAISHTAEVARNVFQDANADLIGAILWGATLDTKTSEICRIRDGLKYDVKTHKPIGHRVPWLQGPGRSHWSCRSVSVPVVKSWRELGFKVKELPPATRASMDGQVPADLSFGDWLKRQSAARQDQVVGTTRGRLMREGKLPFDQLYSSRGEYLSLDELRKRDSAAFVRAGL